MFRELFSYKSRLMPHEAEAFSQIYGAIDPGINLDIASNVSRVTVKWKSSREYQLKLDIGNWVLPRLWGKPILDGFDSDNRLSLHIEVDGLFGLPTQMDVSANTIINLSRRIPVPVRWHFHDLDFARRPPLTREYIQNLEKTGMIRLPKDLIEFMTSDRGAAMRHAIGPLTIEELIEPDEWNYYRILTDSGNKDLILRLNHADEPRDELTKAYVVDYTTHEMKLLATGIDEGVSSFIRMCRHE